VINIIISTIFPGESIRSKSNVLLTNVVPCIQYFDSELFA
jgi:hypothetical protein